MTIIQLLTSFIMSSDFFSAWMAGMQTEIDLPNAAETSAGFIVRVLVNGLGKPFLIRSIGNDLWDVSTRRKVL